jgi:hypothetical protein
MSPITTEPAERTGIRRSPLARKIAICAAAIAVTVLPTACNYAYADQTGESGHSDHADNGPQELIPVGGGSDENADDEQNGGAEEPGGEEPGAGDGADDNAADGGNGDGNADDGAGNGGENGNAGGNAGGNGGDNGNAGGNGGDNGNAGGNGGENGNGGGNGGGQENNGLDVLGRDCSNSDLAPHTGFQEAPACVDTAFGEVAGEDKSPSLLITDSPQTVKAGEAFTISVSTRNLVRDRFLGAAAGGYYLESSFLNEDGIQRGHFHTACRMLDSLDTAPDAAPAPEFFVATQDNGGGAAPDTVEITVTGMPSAGTAQCAVWAGDGSHRIPMMQRANQTPAFDAVRITVE